MADARYRYKGKFISAHKARSLANLKGAKKYLTTEYTYRGKADAIRKGYHAPLEEQLKKAFRRSTEAPRQELKPAQKRRAKKRYEDSLKLREQASEVTRYAKEFDISIEDAAEELYESGEFFYAGPDSLADYANDYAEFGDEYFDFEMADLENDDKYKSR